MIDLVRDILDVAEKYGLRILNIDATDVTLMARLEILPTINIQIYQNLRKEKLNLALIFGNTRIYGIDKEGRFYHQHPVEDPESHVIVEEGLKVEDFVVECLNILKEREIL